MVTIIFCHVMHWHFLSISNIESEHFEMNAMADVPTSTPTTNCSTGEKPELLIHVGWWPVALSVNQKQPRHLHLLPNLGLPPFNSPSLVFVGNDPPSLVSNRQVLVPCTGNTSELPNFAKSFLWLVGTSVKKSMFWMFWWEPSFCANVSQLWFGFSSTARQRKFEKPLGAAAHMMTV